MGLKSVVNLLADIFVPRFLTEHVAVVLVDDYEFVDGKLALKVVV